MNSTIAFLHAEIEEVKESNTNLVSNVDAWKTQAEVKRIHEYIEFVLGTQEMQIRGFKSRR